MPVDKKLLPVKTHYFFFNAGTAPLVPYMSTYARQMGFSASTVGLIYTVLPLFGLFAKPFFGAIADKFRAQKTIFLLFQVVTILSFSAIYFIPQNVDKIPVQMACSDGVSVLQTCYPPDKNIDKCKIDHIAYKNSTICKMECNRTDLDFYKPACDTWRTSIPCCKTMNAKGYHALISNVSVTNDCINIESRTVDMGEGRMYETTCGNGGFNQPCYLECSDPTLSAMTHENVVKMTCNGDMLNYQFCNNDSKAIMDTVKTKDQFGKCKVYFNTSTSVTVVDVCEEWNTGGSNVCRIKYDDSFPAVLKFEASLALKEIIGHHNNCLLIDVDHIKFENGSIHYPHCPLSDDPWPSLLFQPQCFIQCENSMVNELLKLGKQDTEEDSQYNFRFWSFLVCMIISWIGQAVVVTFADAICFNILGLRVSLYGKQRLWGSFGWGIVSLLTGVLIDLLSEGAYKDYTIAFILMIIFMSGDVITSCFIKVEPSQMSINIIKDVGSMLSSYATVLFLLWTVAVGFCTAMTWQFLFWLIEDIANQTCEDVEYVKTLQGLVSAIQIFAGEIPFMFLSGYMLNKFGHNHIMSAVLFGFGIRFILYSHLVDAWWILPIELFQGLTSGMFYPTMTSYANIVAPPGTETTVQGLVGALFEGVGCSLGSFIGGRLYDDYGGALVFRCFGYGALVACGLHAIAMLFVKKETRMGLTPGNKNLE